MSKRSVNWPLPPSNRRLRLSFPSSVWPYTVAGSAKVLSPEYLAACREEHVVQLLRIPYDLLHNIASFMSPQSLLALARTCKALWFDLTHNVKDGKSDAYYIWVAAERAVGIPRCPPTLTGPQYAALVYDNDCKVCGSVDAKFDVSLMTRLCLDCLQLRCMKGSELIYRVAGSSSERTSVNLNLHAILTGETTGSYPHWSGIDDLTISKNLKKLYYIPKIAPVLERYMELEHARLGIWQEFFFEERRLVVKDRRDFEWKMKCWWKEERRAFKKGIKRKLNKRGHDWENLTQVMDSPELAASWKEHLDKIGDLSEDAEGELLVKLEVIVAIRKEAWRVRRKNCRNVLLDKLAVGIWEMIWYTLGHYPCFSMEELRALPTSQRILEDDSLKESAPPELLNDIQDSTIRLHFERWLPIEAEIREKVERVRSEVSMHVMEDGPDEDMNCSALRFSTTLFRCRSDVCPEGWELKTYDEVLMDIDRKRTRGGNWECNEVVWDDSMYEVSARAVRVAESVLAHLGWDISAPEKEQMKELTFVCHECDEGVEMIWSKFIEHCIREDSHKVGKVALDDIPCVWQSEMSVLLSVVEEDEEDEEDEDWEVEVDENAVELDGDENM